MTAAATFTDDFKACLAEAIATFALCFIGGGSICVDAMLGEHGPGLLGIALAHGIVLSIAVTATMNVSGGHVNPAVTVAMLATGRIAPLKAGLYILSQCAGGAVAGMLLMTIARGVLDPAAARAMLDTGLGTPAFDTSKIAASTAVIIEGVLTFLLLFAVFGTAVDPRHPNVGGFGIGLMVGVDILVGGPLTGAAMNPARAFGTGIIGGTADFWGQQWVYWIGPCAGGVLAAAAYHFGVLGRQK
ncbi:MAG: aquaporin [Phycisphaerae bacterium]|nr:aquaporin [Phycisphaerae bacterium]NUQ46951.1 aquaporin [Phycisphaerae bacterium]